VTNDQPTEVPNDPSAAVPEANVPEASAAGASLVRLKVLGVLLFIVWLPFDLWSKSWMQNELGLVAGQPRSAHEVDIIPGFLAWQGTWNPGVTFGLAGGQTNLILTLTSIATLGLIIWFFGTRLRSRCLHVGLSLILAGAIGNLWDRWQWGQVRDFILVYLGKLEDPSWTWPNFNVADAGIVVGVILVLWDALFGFGAADAKRKTEQRKAARSQAHSS
jgi:signal peptidase II